MEDRDRPNTRDGAIDKAEGRANEQMGTLKKKVGQVLGDQQLQAEGSIQRGEGKIDRAKGAVKETVEDAKDTAKAGVQKAADKITGRDRGDR